jgi:TonB-dependent receptor
MVYELIAGAAALVALSASAPVEAQQGPISLQSQPVAAALQALAHRTGAQILFTPDLVRGRTGHEVSAAATADAALSQLLADTGLTYQRTADSTFAIVARKSAERRQDALLVASAGPAAPEHRALASSPLDAITDIDVSEVTVWANRLSEEAALQEQLQSIGVNNVLSAEQIEQAPVSSVADLSSLIPGLAQHRDEFQGQAATGEGQYITIRGFDTSYNAYSLNGLRLAQTDADSRAVSMNLFSPFGLSSIKVDKAPTSDEDGDSIAGILDLRTPTAFDFSGEHFLVRTQGQLSEQALDTDQAAGGLAAQVEYANRFGGDNRWGIYATAYYQHKDTTAEEVAAQNAPVLDNDLLSGTPRNNNPDNLVMNGEQWNFYRELIERSGGNLSLDFHGDNTSLYWRALFAHYTNDMNQDQQSLRTSSITGQLPPTTNNQSASVPGLNSQTGISETEYNAASGDFAPYGVQPGHYWQYNEFDQELFDTQLGGETRLQSLPLTFDYVAGYSHGEYDNGQHFEAGQWGAPYIGSGAGNGAGVATEGLSFNLSNPTRPVPVLSPAAAAYLYNPNSTNAWSIDSWDNFSNEGLLSLREDTTLALQQGGLDSIKAGLKYERAVRDSDDTGDEADERVYVGLPGVVQNSPQQPQFYQGAGPSTAAFPGSYLNSFMGGAYPGLFKLVNPNAYKSLWTALEAANPVNQAAAATAYADSRVDGTETRYAGYLEALLKFGDLVILPGVRYELNQDRFTTFQQQTVGGEYVTNSKSYGEWLPGISATWRPDDAQVYRASIRKSYARPAFDQLYGATSVTTDVDGNVSINEPNPNLKPVTSINYDLGYERYDHQGGVLQIDGYYKQLHNVIFAAGATNASTDITNNVTTIAGTTTVNTTLNGLGGYAYGVELNIRKRLLFLPAPYDGFGVGGNLTAQRTGASYALSPTDIQTAQLPNAPDLMYNLELFYDKYGFKAALDYSYQGLAMEQIQETDPDIYAQPVKTLNLSTSYQFSFGLRAGFAVRNLLNAYTYWATYGKGTALLAQGANNEGGFVETGRIFLLNVTYQIK